MHIDFGCVFGCFLDAKWKQNRSKMCPKSISECTSFSEAFLERFLMAKWCKSDLADLCFDIAGVRRTAIFHKSSSTVFHQIWEPKMIQQIDLKYQKNNLKIDSNSCPILSFSEAFLDRFLMAKWCKSDFADLCFDKAGVRRTAIFH